MAQLGQTNPMGGTIYANVKSRFEVLEILMNRACCTISLLIVAATAFGQSASPSSSLSLSGLAILEEVSRHYSEAKSYHIESVEERTDTNDFQHTWQKTVLFAAEAPNSRYHYEGHTGMGAAMRVSDGTTEWIYRVDEHTYTKKSSTPSDSPVVPHVISMSENGLMRAEDLRKELGALGKHYKSADRLPDANLSIDGEEIPCYVVRVRSADMKRTTPDYSFERTLWIDKAHDTVLQVQEHEHTYMLAGNARIPMEVEIKTSYTVVDLDTQLPESLFTFTPPADAKLLDKFPDGMSGPNLTGQAVPPLKLKSADGKIVSLEFFRGKPVLLDVWATWCAPCVKSLPQLAQLHAETQGKGLVLLTIDQDEDAKTAADMLAKRGYNWPNFHDDGDVGNVLGPSGIPRTLLIDSNGKVVFDGFGVEDSALRREIARLGPEYVSLAPKVAQTPCAVAK